MCVLNVNGNNHLYLPDMTDLTANLSLRQLPEITPKKKTQENPNIKC